MFRVRDKMHLSFMQNRYFMLLLLYDFLLSMSDIIKRLDVNLNLGLNRLLVTS